MAKLQIIFDKNLLLFFFNRKNTIILYRFFQVLLIIIWLVLFVYICTYLCVDYLLLEDLDTDADTFQNFSEFVILKEPYNWGFFEYAVSFFVCIFTYISLFHLGIFLFKSVKFFNRIPDGCGGYIYPKYDYIARNDEQLAIYVHGIVFGSSILPLDNYVQLAIRRMEVLEKATVLIKNIELTSWQKVVIKNRVLKKEDLLPYDGILSPEASFNYWAFVITAGVAITVLVAGAFFGTRPDMSAEKDLRNVYLSDYQNYLDGFQILVNDEFLNINTFLSFKEYYDHMKCYWSLSNQKPINNENLLEYQRYLQTFQEGLNSGYLKMSTPRNYKEYHAFMEFYKCTAKQEIYSIHDNWEFFICSGSLLITEYLSVFVYFLVGGFLSCVILSFSYLLVVQKPETEKTSRYECGFESYEDARQKFNVKFYLLAILFILFDIETMFLVPWCVTISLINYTGYLVMLEFIIELFLGFLYVWYINGFDWK